MHLSRPVLLPLLASMAASLVACRKPESPQPWIWHPGTVAEALAAARAENRLVLVAVEATWCPSCRQLERNVFERAASRLPQDRLLGAKVDFDTPEGQAFVQRYRVVGLPTTVVLDPDGGEKGRVEGFDDDPEHDGVGDYVAGIRRAMEGADDLAGLVRRQQAAPADPKIAAETGAAQLAHGNETEGIRLLELARTLDPKNEAGANVDATRILGRYEARVRRDFDRALAYFREGVAAAGDSPAAWGFRYWIAMVLEQAGRHDEAVAFLDALMVEYPEFAEPPALKAEFLYMNRLDNEEALGLATKAAEIEPTDDWNHYLVGVLAERVGRRTVALQAARRAVELAPGKAIYEELLERLEATNPEPAAR